MFSAEIKAVELPVSLEEFRLKALAWADQHPHVAYYNPNNIPYPHDGFEHLLAFSSDASLSLREEDAFNSLRQELQQNHPLLCGFLTYDLKNQVEKLQSKNADNIEFPLLHFFSPTLYMYFKQDSISVYSKDDNITSAKAEIIATPAPFPATPGDIEVKQRIAKRQYINDVERIRQHILEGEVYELNYCIEFYAENIALQPLPLYLALNETSPTPFSGYLKCQDKYLLCASPERFLKKENQKLISQPIKGTIRRGATPQEDATLQHQLRHDEKELAENMMIVDLVRNDLSHSCATGTVQVEEMFGIYGFKQVSQMMSTIVGELRPEKDLVDALKGAFPMGSMTGAPKISAMQHIEKLEVTRRGLYSGAFGYIKQNNDCDFNVVIRSIQYNSSQKYLSFMVGSAITYDSVPEQEYAECLLKAQAILKVLGQA
ncbi:anthranilate synthase component I family protein [Pontibacter pamirensis]|uniref:anthranilate synthase component I family protein n=1 Tax=Pontibacter pamirensis TaxID=2562824 RepID=UPI00192E4660|nr:anthranilate synthase component I family protein [Pontibacter pamirensis]